MTFIFYSLATLLSVLFLLLFICCKSRSRPPLLDIWLFSHLFLLTPVSKNLSELTYEVHMLMNKLLSCWRKLVELNICAMLTFYFVPGACMCSSCTKDSGHNLGPLVIYLFSFVVPQEELSRLKHHNFFEGYLELTSISFCYGGTYFHNLFLKFLWKHEFQLQNISLFIQDL